jgi:hypothetical protein
VAGPAAAPGPGSGEGGIGRLLGILVEPPAASAGPLGLVHGPVRVGEQGGQVPARPAFRDPTLTVNVTGFPSLPVTRAGGPVSRAAVWIARRLVIQRRPAHRIDDLAQPPDGTAGRPAVSGYRPGRRRTGLRRDGWHRPPEQKPWPKSQPRACSSERTASDSTPSATTFTPSWWARSTVVRTMVRKLTLLAIGRTSDMSSLSSLTGPAAQALQRGEAGAEVVEGDPYAELGQLGEEADADRGGRGLLAHLQREHPARHLLGAQELGDDGREPGSVTESGSTLTEIGTTQPAAAQTRCCTSDSRSISRVSSPISPSCSAAASSRGRTSRGVPPRRRTGRPRG